MGLEVKRNKSGKFKLTSTVSGERLHDELWVTEDEAKNILVTKKFWEFVDATIKVDMEFPDGYRVNDEYNFEARNRFNIWWLDNVDKEDGDKILTKTFDDTLKRLNLGIKVGKNEKEEIWEVGFGYYYSDHRTTKILVRGTREQALDYLKNTYIPTQPDWMTSQISDKPYSEDRCGIFINEAEIIDYEK